jgi:hypothetical protein
MLNKSEMLTNFSENPIYKISQSKSPFSNVLRKHLKMSPRGRKAEVPAREHNSSSWWSITQLQRYDSVVMLGEANIQPTVSLHFSPCRNR